VFGAQGVRPDQGGADYAPGFLAGRTGDGMYRFIEGLHDTLVVGHHIFSDDADPAETEQSRQHRLAELFAWALPRTTRKRTAVRRPPKPPDSGRRPFRTLRHWREVCH
jgi:hypothetical protein